MAFSERIQQLCPGVSNEQATELREFLVEASERLEAEPSLLGISLKTLEQEATDQGYELDTVVMVLQEAAKATSEGDSPEQLMAAWQTCMASEGSVADFIAVLTDQFPELKSAVEELVDEAQEEHRALSGVAGGTSSWRIDSSRTPTQKKEARLKDVKEAAILIGTGLGVTWTINTIWVEKKAGNIARTEYSSCLTQEQVNSVQRQLWHTQDPREMHFAQRYVFTGSPRGVGGITMTPKKRFYMFRTEFTFSSTWEAIRYQASKLNPKFIFNANNRMLNLRQDLGLDRNSVRSSQLLGNETQDFDVAEQHLSNDSEFNPRRMNERIHKAAGHLLGDESDDPLDLPSQWSLSRSSLAGFGKDFPPVIEYSSLWKEAKVAAFEDLSGDVQVAKSRAARSVSADVSGMAAKELEMTEDL